MAYRIACELSDKVKAIAAVAATMPAHINYNRKNFARYKCH